MRKIWIEFGQPSPKLKQDKKNINLQGMDFQEIFSARNPC
jgi:hypothetical protein